MTQSEFETARAALTGIDPVVHAPARLMILSYLYVVDSADYVFLMRLTGLTWGNIAAQLGKLEEAGYVEIEKSFNGKKPRSTVRLTDTGRNAFREYRRLMRQVLDDLPA